MQIGKRVRVTGRERAKLAANLRKMYEDEGLSIRRIAERRGISYGRARTLLPRLGFSSGLPAVLTGKAAEQTW